MAGQMPNPLLQEWFGLNRKLNSHLADKKFCFFLGGAIAVSRTWLHGEEIDFLASSVIFLSFLQIHT